MNKVILRGRLARDPDIRTTQSGKQVARLTIACDRYGKDAGADFVPCVAWEGVARVIGDYFRKGRMILAEGSIGTRSYEAKDGGKRYVIQKVEFCGDAEEPFGGEPEYEDTPF